MSERSRRESIMEGALRGIAWGFWEDGPSLRRKALIAQAQNALKRVEESRRIEAEAKRLCEEEVHEPV